MTTFWRIFRFLIVPLLSLIATIIFPIVFPGSSIGHLWLLWIVAFISVCEGGPSAAAWIRPTVWVGLHLTVIFLF